MAFIAVAGISLTSCEDEPDKYESTDGVPTIKYVRMASSASSDSLITGAYMDNTICIVGDNLRSTLELWFNDQQAVLNTSYITDHTMLVTVPGVIPSEVTNTMRFVAKDGTVEYPFNVIVPEPSLLAMSCEYAPAGSEVTITGNYFIDDPNVPFVIDITDSNGVATGISVTEFTDFSQTSISFIMPEGLNGNDYFIDATSIYGTGRSSFHYRDTRNILFDWDGSHGGLTSGHGWRSGNIRTDDPVAGIDGSYIYFGGTQLTAGGWDFAEDAFSFNYWPEPSAGFPELSSMPEFAEMLDRYDLSELQVKFEIYVPSSNPWMSSALQVIFSGNDVVTYATANNSYLTNGDQYNVPRGLWIPWQATGSYDTGDQWATASMPLANFTYTNSGEACTNALSKDGLTGVTFFVWAGGVEGQDCSPIICIDNIRVVPIN